MKVVAIGYLGLLLLEAVLSLVDPTPPTNPYLRVWVLTILALSSPLVFIAAIAALVTQFRPRWPLLLGSGAHCLYLGTMVVREFLKPPRLRTDEEHLWSVAVAGVQLLVAVVCLAALVPGVSGGASARTTPVSRIAATARNSVVVIAILLGVAAVARVYRLTAASRAERAGQMQELDANLQKWRRHRITHYSLQIETYCFCTSRMPVTVEVRNGAVLSVIDDTGQPAAADDPLRSMSWLTVEGAFAYTRDAIERADRVEVSYHAQFGYPAELRIDWIERALDDEMTMLVAELHALP